MRGEPNLPSSYPPEPLEPLVREAAKTSRGPLEPAGSMGSQPELDTITVTVAPLWRRACASLIDLVVPLGLWALATWLIITSDPEPPPVAPWNIIDQVVDYLHDRPGRSLASGLVFFMLQVLWPLVFGGRTPGRRLMALRFMGPDGRPPSLVRLLVWSLVRVPLLALAGISAWWAIVDPERRTLHDRAASIWLTHRARRAP
jgi:uncharacterized RDD family membrane protein YckC